MSSWSWLFSSIKSHRRPRRASAIPLGVAIVVLLRLDVGPDIFRRHQPNIVAVSGEHATEMMGAAAGLHPDNAWSKLLRQSNQRLASYRTSHNDRTGRIPLALRRARPCRPMSGHRRRCHTHGQRASVTCMTSSPAARAQPIVVVATPRPRRAQRPPSPAPGWILSRPLEHLRDAFAGGADACTTMRHVVSWTHGLRSPSRSPRRAAELAGPACSARCNTIVPYSGGPRTFTAAWPGRG